MTPSTDSPTTRSGRLPGDEGVWFFIVADTAMFAVLFLIFLLSRQESIELFEQGRASLSIAAGLFNTVVLLTSSMAVALGVLSARNRDLENTRRYLRLGIAVGVLFALAKVYEYGAKFNAGIAINTNDFYMFYFALTGIHFFHYIGGMIVLSICLLKLNESPDPLNASYQNWIESSGCYWHMVDMLWIVLFPLLYLLRVPT